MTIIFTRHARLRQKQRKISGKTIIEALEKPDVISEDKTGNPLIGKRINHHAIIVVYKNRKEKRIIVTVYKTSYQRLKKLKAVIKGKL